MSESARRYEENSNVIKEIRASMDVVERRFGSLPSSTEANPRDHVKSISTTAEANENSIRRCQSALDPRKTVFATAHAKIDVFKRKITIRIRDEKIIFKSVKPSSSLIKRVYMLSLRERMELDLEARLMRETLVLNRSLYPLYGDYIELNDLNVPLELRRDQDDDLMPTIRKVSDYDHDKKIRISCPYNLKFSCMIDFAVLEDVDAYRDEGMGDVIFSRPLLREVKINVRRFEEIITIYKGNEEVTYQMVWSHPRFKCHNNEQCNKISPLLKVSKKDKMNGISHLYQKLKSFYKEVLNLGLEYV
ncbi:hypothetical protein Tco_0590772 [Tanacetum coccineum]